MSQYIGMGIWPFPAPTMTKQQITATQSAAKKAEEAAKKAQATAVAKAQDSVRQQVISNQIASRTKPFPTSPSPQQAWATEEKKTPWAIIASAGAVLVAGGILLKMTKKKKK